MIKEIEVLIYGIGDTAKEYNIYCRNCGYHVIGFIQTNKERVSAWGLPVYDMDEIKGLHFDEIHIANSHLDTYEELIRRAVPLQKIVVCNAILNKRIHGIKPRYNSSFAEDYENRLLHQSVVRTLSLNYYLPSFKGEDTEYYYEGEQRVVFNQDFVRLNTLKLLIKEIMRNHVEGDCARKMCNT